MKTSTNLQLLDTNNTDISPIVGVDSIFYEDTSTAIVKRKTLHDKLLLSGKNGALNIQDITYDDASNMSIFVDISTLLIENAEPSMYTFSAAKVSMSEFMDIIDAKIDAGGGGGDLTNVNASIRDISARLNDVSNRLSGVGADVDTISAHADELDTICDNLNSSVQTLWDKQGESGIQGVKRNSVELTPDSEGYVNVIVPTNLNQLNSDSNHRVVTDAQINLWNNAAGGGSFDPTDINSSITRLNTSVNNINSSISKINASLTYLDSSVKNLWDSSKSGGDQFDPTDINSSITRLNTSVNNINSSISKINASLTYLDSSVKNLWDSSGEYITNDDLKTVNKESIIGAGNIDTTTPELLTSVSLSLPQMYSTDPTTNRVLYPGSIIAYNNQFFMDTAYFGYMTAHGNISKWSLVHPWFFYDGPELTSFSQKIDTSVFLVKNNVSTSDGYWGRMTGYTLDSRYLNYASNGDTIYLYGKIKNEEKYEDKGAETFYIPTISGEALITLDGIASEDSTFLTNYKFLSIGILTDKDNGLMQFIGGNMMNKVYEWDSKSNQLVPYVLEGDATLNPSESQIINHDYTKNTNEFDFANWQSDTSTQNQFFAFKKQKINYNFDPSTLTGSKIVNVTFSYENIFDCVYDFLNVIYKGGDKVGNIGNDLCELEYTFFGVNKSTIKTGYIVCNISSSTIKNNFGYDEGGDVHVFVPSEFLKNPPLIYGGSAYMMHVKFVEDIKNSIVYIYVKDFVIG